MFGPTLINEVRFGFFNLEQLAPARRSVPGDAHERGVGVPNPANNFDNSSATHARSATTSGGPARIMERFSFGGPNDTFNRAQAADLHHRRHADLDRRPRTRFAFGGEFRRNAFDTNLPEEQATEFEKFDNFTQMLRGLGTRGATRSSASPTSGSASTTSTPSSPTTGACRAALTLNLGLRYEFFGWPEEMDGRIGNVDFEAITNTEDPSAGFIVPSNVATTGFAAIDEAIAASAKVDNKHTLKGQDWNNFAPRARASRGPPTTAAQTVIRGGYGIFYDRPSSAFINTVFSNYPFLREVEVTFPSRAVPLDTAFSQQNPTSASTTTCPTASSGRPARPAPTKSATARVSHGAPTAATTGPIR